MREHFAISIRITAVLVVITCGIYPALVWGIGQLAFPRQANGSWVASDGRVVGSSLIGQDFTDDRFFHPRPSSAGSKGYDATASGGSNLGPTSVTLRDTIAKRIAGYGPRPPGGVPADAVTASASGLDPHISPANAEAQASRVARANGLRVDVVRTLIEQRTEGRFLGVYGEPRVNVLALNVALKGAAPELRRR